jgi:nucleoside-diphosphate-sugar epimerase
VNSSLEAGVDHFIHVSSVAAIGRDAKNKAPLNEDNFWKNDPTNSNYAISKYLSENEVWRGIEEGLSAAIVNPAIILGPGNWNNSSNVIFKNFSKYFPFYSKGSAAFVDVRDVVDVMLQLSDRNITEERYILAGSNRPFREMFSKIAESFQVKQPSYPVSALMAGLIWRFEFVRSLLTGSKPLLTKETVAASASNWTYDTSKVQNDLGFSFRNLDHSIPEFVKFYQKTQLSRD